MADALARLRAHAVAEGEPIADVAAAVLSRKLRLSPDGVDALRRDGDGYTNDHGAPSPDERFRLPGDEVPEKNGAEEGNDR